MKLSTGAKIGFAAIAIGAAYYLYQLYQVGERLVYSVSGIRIQRSGTQVKIIVRWKLDNRATGTAKIKGVRGRLLWDGKHVSDFSGPGADIKPGIMDYSTEFVINNTGVATALITSIFSGKWPVLTVEMETRLGLFTVRDSYDIDTKDYLTEILTSLKQ